MKTTATLLRSVMLLLVLSTAAVKGQGGLIGVAPQQPTRVTDCDTGLLVGPGYAAQLMWGPVGTPEAGFVALGAPRSIVNGVLTFSGTFNLPLINGSPVSLFAAAWETGYGNTYDQARLVPGAHVGRSPNVSVTVGPPTPPIPDTSQFRIPDFQVCPVPVPEPSVIGVGALAVGAWLFLRRPKA